MNKKHWIVKEFRNLELDQNNPGAWAWNGIPKNELRQYLTREILKHLLKNKKPVIEVRDLDNYIKWVIQDGYIDQDTLGQLKLSSKGKIFISKWYDFEKIKFSLKLEDWLSNFIWLFLVAILVVVIGGVVLARLSRVPETKKYSFATEFNFLPNEDSKLTAVNCWVNSLSSTRPDAFRCMDDKYIYDPCFGDDAKRIVICPENPHAPNKYFSATFDTNKDSILINRYLYPDTTTNQPWYIKLYDGSECYLLTGASDLVAGMRMDYGCDNQKEFLLLPITESGLLEKIGCFKDNKIEQCGIKEVWY